MSVRTSIELEEFIEQADADIGPARNQDHELVRTVKVLRRALDLQQDELLRIDRALQRSALGRQTFDRERFDSERFDCERFDRENRDIAHDLGNVLMGIRNAAAIACEQVAPTHAAHEYLKECALSAKRGVHLARELLRVGRGRTQRGVRMDSPRRPQLAAHQ